MAEKYSAHPGKPFPILQGTRDIFEGRVLKLRVDEIEVRDGINVRREVVLHPGAVVMLAVADDGRILWVRQHRWAVGKPLLELPAGTLEPNEAPDTTAQRELAEEVGFRAAQIERMGGFYVAPGYSSEYIHAYLATGLSEEQAEGDEDEDIEVVPLTLDESLAAIDAGEVEDAKSISTVLYYLRRANR